MPDDPFAAAKAFDEQFKRPDPKGNPYKPGTEQWDWYNTQLAKPRSTPVVAPPISNPFAGAPGADKIVSPQLPASPVYHGSLLPFSRDSRGKVYFDPTNAGPVGAVRTGMQYGQDLLTGKRDFPTTFDPSVLPRSQTSRTMGDVLNMTGFGGIRSPAIRVAPHTVTGTRMPSDYSMVEPLPGPATKARGADQIQAFKTLPIDYDPAYVGTNLATRLEQIAHDNGARRTNSPQLYAIIDELKNTTPGGKDPSAEVRVTPASLASARESLTRLYSHAGGDKPSEHYAGLKEVHKAFDEFLSNTPPEAFAPGTNPKLAAAAPALYDQGRGNYAGGANDETFGQIQREAQLRELFRNRNPSATVKDRVAAAILKADEDRSLSPAQQEVLSQVPEKSWPRQIASGVGNVLSSGPFGTIGYGLGVAAGHVAGLGEYAPYVAGAVPLAGQALTKWAGSTAPAALDVARRYMLQQTPDFADRIALGLGRGDIDVTPNAPSNTLLTAAQQYLMTHPQGVPLKADETNPDYPRPPISY